MKALPAGWRWAKGEEVFEFVTSGSRGWARHYAAAGSSFIRIGNLDHHTITLDLSNVQHVQPPPGAEGERTRLKADDILVSITAELGMVGLVPAGLGDAYINQHIALARPRAGNDPRFLAWYLASEADGKRLLLSASRGGTKAGLGLDDIRQIDVPIAPLSEQQHIADKLDAILARVAACRDRLDRVALLLQRFRQSVLGAAIGGDLTAQWRAQHGVTESWSPATIGDVAEVGTGSTPLRSRTEFFSSDGTPWVTSSATSFPFVERSDEYVTPAAIAAHRLRIYPPGTLLMAMYGEGKTRGQVTELGIAATINQACAAVTVDAALANRDFVKLALQGSYLQLRAMAEGGNQPNLNLSKVRSMPLRLPGMIEQQEIVRRVRHLSGLHDQVQRRLHAARRLAMRCTPAVLAKAFRGELVPQDPSDETAPAPNAQLAAQVPSKQAVKRRRLPA